MSAPLTIIHLVPSLDGGGVETDVVGLSAALVRAGHRSIVVSGGGRLAQRIVEDGGEHVTLPVGRKSPLTLRAVAKVRRLAARCKADIVHAHSRVPAWVGWLATRGLPGTRFVTTIHGLNTPGFFSAVMLRGEKVVAVSDTVRAFLEKNYPRADLSKVVVIPRGVDPAAFPFGFKPDGAWMAAWQAQFPQLKGKFTFTLAGRLTRLKGHHDALAALEHLRSLGVDAHLLLVGGEDPRRQAYAQELRQAVVRKQLEDHVTFTGHRSDIREVLAASGAVVSCSTKPETFGLSVLEAVRLGVPVVGYAHGGVGEVLARVYPEGRVAFEGVSPEARTRQMAEKLEALARGEMAKPKPGAQFPLAETHRKTIALYESLAAGK